MARVSLDRLLLASRRLYGTTAELRSVSISRVAKTAESNTRGEEKVNEKVYWMRDPKTGNWIPEDHFGEVDVVELRQKFRPRNPN